MGEYPLGSIWQSKSSLWLPLSVKMSSSRDFNESLKGAKTIAVPGDIQTREEGYVTREASLGPRIEPTILSPLPLSSFISPIRFRRPFFTETRHLRMHGAHGSGMGIRAHRRDGRRSDVWTCNTISGVYRPSIVHLSSERSLNMA